MPTLLESKSIYYDQINLIAQPQYNIVSRSEIPERIDKFIVSPMEAVVGKTFAVEALKLGLTLCLHRFGTLEEQKEILHALYDADESNDGWQNDRIWVAVGLNDMDRVEKLNHRSILVDVANGYLVEAAKFARKLQSRDYRVMVGNVHSSKGFNLYENCFVRVGIGNSGVCRTGQVTGYNRGQVTEIIECSRDRYSPNQKLVADGGIKGSGEAAKAFGLGSDYVMMGNYFSLAEEAENVIKGEYKYWGGASHTQQIKQHGEIKRHSEGGEVELDKSKIRPLKTLVSDLWGGVASAVSYSGFGSLEDFAGNGVFELKN